MLRIAFIAFALAATAAAGQSRGPNDQLVANVSRELPGYLPGVDASTLSRSQLAALYMIMHSSESGNNKHAMIRSIVGGQYSLRGLLFK